MKKIISIIGARPQFIKHAPMQLQLQKHFNALTIHTGQHYDSNMSEVFFKDLNIPLPDFLFDIGGSKPQGEQTAIMLTEIEKVCIAEKPDAILIYGDTNSTLAAALIAVKMQIPQIHIEAGLRSFNLQMPEEVNRIIADRFATMLFCPTQQAIKNLKAEGIDHNGIYLCGDVMCDMLKIIQPETRQIKKEPYYFVTLHRPYNTDNRQRLTILLQTLNNLKKPVVFPLHPRTFARMDNFGLSKDQFPNIQFIAPVGYVESVSYQKFADCIITDSGGMQKEAYMLGKKCITIRSETEWSETLVNGWNTLLFNDIEEIKEVIEQPPGEYIADVYGDGNAAAEIAGIILKNLK